ncbi:fimbrial biogenesis chaperone [Microbulbifer guangxiensis]|uniref:fimbrial biogenesis chaperone n=1 Tax=Microbulbifer guangxiensis TaxID=2904249 RepID=UPI001F020B1E|nr:fimbria/pilus periplasmic chaperone [Microbulbifer guangxiensis]
MVEKTLRVFIGIFFLTLIAKTASAFTLEPTVTVLELPADVGGETLLLRNPRNVDLPVMFEVMERKINEDGSEEATPADDEFVVFPPQAVVRAGKTQAVRIQWVGGDLSQSRSFTLYASELPLSLNGEQKSGVTTVFRMGASIHVTSKGFVSQPKLVRYRPEKDGVVVSIGNDGNEFIYVDMLRLKFGNDEVGGFELANIAGRTLITPGAVRTFKVGGVQGAPKLQREE